MSTKNPSPTPSPTPSPLLGAFINSMRYYDEIFSLFVICLLLTITLIVSAFLASTRNTTIFFSCMAGVFFISGVVPFLCQVLEEYFNIKYGKK